MAHDDISTTIAMTMSEGKKMMMMMMLSNYLARIDFSAVLAYY